MNPIRFGPALLFCPGHRTDLHQKVLARADTAIFDLEDAVPDADKATARAAVAQAAASAPEKSVVRINGVGSAWFADDVTAMQRAGVRYLMLPKASGAHELDLLTDFEVVALCETASGILAASDMAARSNCVALMWGGEDLIADTGGRSSRGADGRYYPTIETVRSAVLLAAAAHRKLAIDAVHIDISDSAGLHRESVEAADLGFGAKACIHPAHVPVIRAAFRPNEAQIQWATDLLAAASGPTGGVFRHGDQMIDAPLLAHARNMMRRNG